MAGSDNFTALRVSRHAGKIVDPAVAVAVLVENVGIQVGSAGKIDAAVFAVVGERTLDQDEFPVRGRGSHAWNLSIVVELTHSDGEVTSGDWFALLAVRFGLAGLSLLLPSPAIGAGAGFAVATTCGECECCNASEGKR